MGSHPLSGEVAPSSVGIEGLSFSDEEDKMSCVVFEDVCDESSPDSGFSATMRHDGGYLGSTLSRGLLVKQTF